MFSIWLSMSYWIVSGGCVVFFGDVAFFIEGSRYVGLILFEEGLDLFSPLVESSFDRWCYYWRRQICSSGRYWWWLMAASDLMFGSTFRRYGRCAFGAFYFLQWLSIQRLFCGLHICGVFCWWGLRFCSDLVLFHGDGVSRSCGRRRLQGRWRVEI